MVVAVEVVALVLAPVAAFPLLPEFPSDEYLARLLKPPSVYFSLYYFYAFLSCRILRRYNAFLSSLGKKIHQYTMKKRGGIIMASTGERPKCPFYGFYQALTASIMVDSYGNQCGLIQDAYAPCKMETAGQIPSWNECPFRGETNVEEARTCKFFPYEYCKEGWEGFTFKEWSKIIIG